MASSTAQDVLVTLPAGVEPQPWTLSGYFYDGDQTMPIQRATQLAFNGTDVYFQGLRGRQHQRPLVMT